MLSVTSEYALRALSCLAQVDEDEALLGRDLAARADVPLPYLAKILLSLRRAGVVKATRGSGGGYQLARAAKSVRLVEVVEVLEGRRDDAICILGGGRACRDEQPCSLHLKWGPLKQAVQQFLETTTLADVATQAESKGRSPRRTAGGQK